MNVAALLARCRDRLNGTDDIDVLESIRRIEQEPINPDQFYQFADLCRRRGYTDLWQSATDLALGLPHVTPRQIFHRGETKLLLGDWSGWLDREARLFHPAHSVWPSEHWRIRWTKRPWNGKENIRDKTLVLVAEGSPSDCLQMLRYVPAVASAAERVVVCVDAELITFVRHNFEHLVTVTDREVEHPIPFQHYAWMMSLPAILGGLPQFVPLRAPRPASRAVLNDSRLQVGVCWPEQGVDIPWEVRRPLVDRDDVQWHTLQVGDSFADTANYIASLDCVVSGCTAIAHLAGVLGIPTLLMLDHAADARWGLADTTPWYPLMRLVRQPMPGDWTSVIDAIAMDLRAHRSTGRSS
jgi:hypothetical protein